MKSFKKWGTWMLYPAVICLVLGCVNDGEMMDKNISKENQHMKRSAPFVRTDGPARPALDLRVPARLETATFALG